MDKKIVAKLGNTIIAEVEKSKTLLIEGNYYFPLNSIKQEFFKKSELTTVCPWKGIANYYNINTADISSENSAWYYANPKEGASNVVSNQNEGRYKGNFANFVAFWKDVKVEEVE